MLGHLLVSDESQEESAELTSFDTGHFSWWWDLVWAHIVRFGREEEMIVLVVWLDSSSDGFEDLRCHGRLVICIVVLGDQLLDLRGG